ncbi:TetR/AcrR family transcriptional regulator [Kineococcus sp. SYSU DK003]|uniref:TetR/AcrR family transcriptional regulator n=1 Tax=Kineococcus sp. SYSU DK003 TaxID=3383124 RepID=UPI003D7DCE5F
MRTAPAPDGRRAAIADAAIEIIARQGLRALTHRAVDRKLGLPDGSTSYYTRTRRDLLDLIVRRLAGRTRDELPPTSDPIPANATTLTNITAPATVTAEQAVQALLQFLQQLSLRPDDHLARFALAIDLVNDPELHPLITHHSPVRQQALAAARSLLTQLGARDPAGCAPALVAVVDGLLFDHLIGSGSSDTAWRTAQTTLTAFVAGLSRIN